MSNMYFNITDLIMICALSFMLGVLFIGIVRKWEDDDE